CTSCYDNIYWLNSGEPKYTLTLPLAMGADNMAVATAAGIGVNTRLTILEDTLIPSYAYLQGDTSATVYRAGCEFVTESSHVAYGVLAYGKTEVVALDYVTGWDSNLNNAYLGVSLKGDDFLGDGSVVERHPDYYDAVYTTNQFPNKITVDGEAGKTESYGLFNHGKQGYYSFVIRAKEEDSEAITIPAGTLFPSRAMRTLFDAYGNPVYIMYQTQTDVTFYKQADGSWKTPLQEKERDITDIKVVHDASNANDQFLLFTLENSDYADAPSTYFGDAVTGANFLENETNFYSHVLVDDQPIAVSGEGIINVWSKFNTFAVRPGILNATKITVLAGCQFPTYNALRTGAREVFTTTEDITFVKNANGEWVEYVPEGDFDTTVTQVQFGRADNVLNINLSGVDYPHPDGNNPATYNIGVKASDILALNLFDNIIIDGYTLRTRYAKNSDSLGEDGWLWVNKFVGHNFAVCVPGEAFTANKIVIRAGAQFPSMAYINNGAQAFYVTTEEVTYVRVSDDVEVSWDRLAKITFQADGEEVKTMSYTKTNGIDGDIPAVPQKAGHKGVWEAYTLNGTDVVVNAVYTAHSFTETETNLSKMEWKEGFLVVFLTNHDYTGAGYTLTVKDKMPNLHFYDFVEVDGVIASTDPASVSKDAFLNVWGGYEGAFATYLPCAAPTQKVVLKAGCQIPSNAYRLDENSKTCFVLTEDVTFLYENGAWVRQSNTDGATSVMKPEYENEYVLSDLYHTSHPQSVELKDGHLLVTNTTDGTVYGYNASHSFSLTFDFSLNIGDNELSAQGDYSIFDISMATRGYSSSHGFGFRFYLYRPSATDKCVELHCAQSPYPNGNITTYTQAGNFEKGQTYRVTIGYRLLDEATGLVEAYLNIDGWESKGTYEMGANYYNFARNVDSFVFSTTSAAGGVRISDPDMTVEDAAYTLTLQNDGEVITQENAWKYTLPELNAYDYGKPQEVFVGWAVNDKLYPAGYELELTENTTLDAIWITMYVQDGAAVRKVGESGLRFLVDINGKDYQDAVEAGFIVGAGTLIVPTSYLQSGVAFVHDSFPDGYFLDIQTSTWSKQTGDTWTYAAALINISPAQYTRSMSARGYLQVQYTTGVGYIYTAYSEDLHARSIYSVATAAMNDDEATTAIENYVNSVADITIDTSFAVSKSENSVGDYTLSVTVDGSTYTVTFDKSVKALTINGVRILAGYTAEILVGDQVHEISGYKLSSNGLTATFTVSDGDMTSYYKAIAEYYANSEEYTALHKAKIQSILNDWGGDYDDAETSKNYIDELATIKTQTELGVNVGATKLATPVISYGLGYAITWTAVANADYYLVTDDNDYRNGVYVLASEDLTYKPEVVGKHNVTVTAYSYYEDYATSDASASFATVEVKPVFTYKAMLDGLYKFDKSQMETMGLANNLNTNNDGTSYYYDSTKGEYFAYYNKYTGWSKSQGYATDWTSPEEFPAHAARLKAMGNNVLLIAQDTNASFKTDSVWETSRTKYVMDTAWTLGMKVLVCDEAFYTISATVSSQSAAAEVIASRAGFADYVKHPAFYGFSLTDEPEPDEITADDEITNVGYMVQALKAACANLGYSKANGNEPFFLACLYQKNVGFSTIWNYENYLNDWLDNTGLDYLYVDLYTGHAMGDSTNRYESTYDVIYGNGTNGVVGSDIKFHQAITAHTQNKGTEGKLIDQDLYMSMLYAAAHNVAGYSWFCYFPITGELAGSMVGFDGNGYGNGIGNNATSGYSYYNAAKTAGYQFELIQGVLNGYKLQTRNYSSNLLTTTLSTGSNTITMYVNADTQNVSATKTVAISGSVCYLVGYGVGTAEAPYQVVSGSVTLEPGQAVICVG
ncbi:MAG: hypothetical protein IJX09_03910, partial [Clostridia bacterium]|nr:hypothetical protein [Clostridia bacterium]